MLNFPKGWNPKGKLDKTNTNLFTSFFSKWGLSYTNGKWSFKVVGNFTVTLFWKGAILIASIAGSVYYVVSNRQIIITLIVKVSNLFN